MKPARLQLTGMQKFSLIWFGQLVSLFGTATTHFALLIWAYDQTGEATTLLVPKSHYGRISGMRSMAQEGANVFGPVFAGLILGRIAIGGLLLIDLATFLVG